MDECARGMRNCNQAVATCVNTIGGSSCKCKEGFIYNAGADRCQGKSSLFGHWFGGWIIKDSSAIWNDEE